MALWVQASIGEEIVVLINCLVLVLISVGTIIYSHGVNS